MADVVDPYKYRRYWVINERAIEEDDFRALEFWPMVGRERNVIGRPLRLNNPEYKDMYFETINGV